MHIIRFQARSESGLGFMEKAVGESALCALLRPTIILERREPNMNCVYDCKLRPHILSWLFLLGMNLELSYQPLCRGKF